jgi:predicted DNA-binding antitoxin AbrB/MazE fold protein
MSLTIDAIYENGVLRPLGRIELPEHQHVRVTVDVVASDTAPPAAGAEDPLEGIRFTTGIADLAEHFDDYRFGRRRP